MPLTFKYGLVDAFKADQTKIKRLIHKIRVKVGRKNAGRVVGIVVIKLFTDTPYELFVSGHLIKKC